MSLKKFISGLVASSLLFSSVYSSAKSLSFKKVSIHGDHAVFNAGVFSKGNSLEEIASKFNDWDLSKGDVYRKVSSKDVHGDKACKSGLNEDKPAYVCATKYSEQSSGFRNLDDTPYWGSLLKVDESVSPIDGSPVHVVTLKTGGDIVIDSKKANGVYNGIYEPENIEIIAFDRDGDRRTNCPQFYRLTYNGSLTLPDCITDGAYGLVAAVTVSDEKDLGALAVYLKDVASSQRSFKAGKTLSPAPAAVTVEPVTPRVIVVAPPAPNVNVNITGTPSTTPVPAVPPTTSPVTPVSSAPPVSPSPAAVTVEPVKFDEWLDLRPKIIVPITSRIVAPSNYHFVGGANLGLNLGNLNLNQINGPNSTFGNVGGELRALLGFGDSNFSFGFIGAYRLDKVGVGDGSSILPLGTGDDNNRMSGEVGFALQTDLLKNHRLETRLLLVPAYLGTRQRINGLAQSNFLESTNGLRVYGELEMPRLLVNGDNAILGLYFNTDAEGSQLTQTNLNNIVISNFGWKTRGIYGAGARLGFNSNGVHTVLGLGFNAANNYSLNLKQDLPIADLMRIQNEQLAGRIDLSRLTIDNVWGYNLVPGIYVYNDKFHLSLTGEAYVGGDINRNGGCLEVGNRYVSGLACYYNIRQVVPDASSENNLGTIGLKFGTDGRLPLKPRVDNADAR